MRTCAIQLLLTLLLISIAQPLHARVIRVPTDYPKIQDGINAASNGDTVMVSPGTYYEHDIDFFGKAITVMSTDPDDPSVVASTIVDADSLGRGFVFQSFENTSSVLSGLTIVGGLLYAEFGSGVFCDSSSPTLTHNVISGNVAGFGGGGIACYYGSPTISDNTIAGNLTTLNGGGIYCFHSTPTISNNTITENTGRNGAGIFCESSSPDISGNTITDNASTDHGGGIHCQIESSPAITGNFISGNIANKRGGGINCDFESSPLISGNTISGNSAGYEEFYGGGGIRSDNDSSPTITSNTITDNRAALHGGGIYCSEFASDITGNTITGNIAGGDGGGIRCRDCSSRITGNVITGNSASGVTGRGGGIDSQNSDGTSIINNLIAGNSAFQGGGFASNASSMTITNNTIVENSATEGGGMLCDGFSGTIVTNTIFWGNGAPEGPEIWLGYLDTLIVQYSNVQGRLDSMHVEGSFEWGDGVIRADPLFLDPSGGDYHLTSESPCVDAGTDTGVSEDYEGDSRLQGYGVDIGADESPHSVAYNLSLTPNGPVTIPRGEDLDFYFLIQNNTEFPVSGDFWLSVELPNHSEIVVPQNFLNLPNPMSGDLPAYSLYNPNVLLSIPMSAQQGSYTLIGRIGTYPGTIFDEDSFNIEVTR